LAIGRAAAAVPMPEDAPFAGAIPVLFVLINEITVPGGLLVVEVLVSN